MNGPAPDVLVVGGGAAGSMAAVAAAQGGCSVIMITRAPGATALSSGAIDLASRPSGYPPAPTTAGQALGTFCTNQSDHPLSRLGWKAVQAVADQGRRLLAADDGLYPDRTWDDEPWYAVTPWGDIHLCWLAQATQFDLARGGRRIGVVDTGPESSLPAWLAVDRLGRHAAGCGRDVSFVAVATTLPAELAKGRPLAVARQLSRDGDILKKLGLALRSASQGHSLDGLLMPPWLGVDDSLAQRNRLNDLVGIPVYETLGNPGDPAGLRLQARLDWLVRQAGVTVVRGRAVALSSEGRELSGVTLKGRPEQMTAGTYVLACGGLSSEGLIFEGELKPSFCDRLPLTSAGKPWGQPGRPSGADPAPLFGSTVRSPHPLLAVGIDIDDELRPTSSDGAPWNNAHVAGALLANADPVHDGSGLSTALVTGFYAGRMASGRAVSP